MTHPAFRRRSSVIAAVIRGGVLPTLEQALGRAIVVFWTETT